MEPLMNHFKVMAIVSGCFSIIKFPLKSSVDKNGVEWTNESDLQIDLMVT